MTHSTESGALVVNCIPCGLSGQPQLRVEEIVRPNPTEAVSAFSNYHVEKGSTSKAKQSYVCTGGHAADFTVHHLIPIDSNATLANLFQITLHQGLRSRTDSATTTAIQPALREWGVEAGAIKTPQEAVAHWNQSKKPVGTLYCNASLGSLAQVVRSKNAGVNEITFDCIFTDEESYNAAKHSPSLDVPSIQALLKRPVLGIFCDDSSLAVKITCDREINAGSQGDRDVYGAQQHRLLVDLPL